MVYYHYLRFEGDHFELKILGTLSSGKFIWAWGLGFKVWGVGVLGLGFEA